MIRGCWKTILLWRKAPPLPWLEIQVNQLQHEGLSQNGGPPKTVHFPENGSPGKRHAQKRAKRGKAVVSVFGSSKSDGDQTLPLAVSPLVGYTRVEENNLSSFKEKKGAR